MNTGSPSVVTTASASTELYRQEVCLLASSFIRKANHTAKEENAVSRNEKINADCSIPTMVAQNIILREQHPGYIPALLLREHSPMFYSAKNAENLNHEDVKEAKMDSEPASSTSESRSAKRTESQVILLPICYNCGGPLQPGVLGCTLTLKTEKKKKGAKRKTARRRESRKNAKALQKQSMIKKMNKRNQPTAPEKSNLSKFCSINQEDNSNEIPKVAKNYAKIRCGCCNEASRIDSGMSKLDTTKIGKRKTRSELASIKLPGVPSTPKNEIHQRVYKRQRSDLSKSSQNSSKKKDEDFISLRGASAQKSKPKLNNLQSSKKKKRKQANPLMDFLSSLND